MLSGLFQFRRNSETMDLIDNWQDSYGWWSARRKAAIYTETTQTDINVSSEIRTHDPSVRAIVISFLLY
jgi:hypothetical protein